ncbi:Phosphoacetylglucosamine mutase [Mycena indigotica]|uniref:Phosphoacetylglucosamine mutase n=1 Tax=Mycena indigotica TaxID=2126181 RepID=A0A8H6WD82_9AGAR|nr:Phosphoacetylglucosamine mutase [Mycena indigotica]KAF7312226.1 Phosphoacetylglucosamine mutase [Mycena indigotica]
MPAERSRYSRRSQADGNAIVWTLPVQPVDESGIGFAPNLTEQNFADSPPPLVDIPPTPVSPCNTFIFSDETTFSDTRQETRRVHARKKSANHIPRPPNAFILFRSSFIKSQQVSETVETNHSTLSKIIGLTWKNLTEDERKVWRQAAAEAVAEHKRNFPTYAFRPKHSRGKKGDTDRPPPKPKRKVREGTYQDPIRCEKIAELLAKGTNGAQLDAAIQEFDKNHVPQIVAKFQAPITARAYRRSSSVPAPNNDDSRPFLAPSPKSEGSPGRRRSSSVGAVALPPHQHHVRPRNPSLFIDTSFNNHQLYEPLNFKQEVIDEGFDFSSFSFSNVTSPAPSVGYDPLSMPMSPCTPLESSVFEASSPTEFTPIDSIDVSALIADEWLLHGQSGHPFGSYPAVAPDFSMPAYSYAPPPYSMAPTTDSGFCSSFKNLAFGEQASFCAAPDPMVGLAQLEADLASFVTQYSL